MPRKIKPARLILRKRKGRDDTYSILDRGRETSTRTGCREEAEGALAAYISDKERRSGPAQAGEMMVAEALAIYGEEYAPSAADPARIGQAIDPLLRFWGDLAVIDIKGATCRRYAQTRYLVDQRTGKPSKKLAAPATIRRELGTLRAAINYCAAEGYLLQAPVVTLPDKPEPKERWLTRDQVAQLLWAARRIGRQRRDRTFSHLCHFILTGVYTGTRHKAGLNMRLEGPCTTGGWFDVDRGLMFRRGSEERVTAKRRNPAPIPRQLLGHLRRWKANGDLWAVQINGNRIGSIKKAFRAVAIEAGQDSSVVTPHILKHTAITWAMQNGATIEDAAGFFSTSTETIERVYWHHSPRFQQSAVAAIEGKRA